MPLCGHLSQVTVITDHKNLQWMFEKSNGKLHRWSMLLSEFYLTIKHRSGQFMCHVDCLSRNPHEDLIEDRMVLSVSHNEKYLNTITLLFHDGQEVTHVIPVHLQGPRNEFGTVIESSGDPRKPLNDHSCPFLRPRRKRHRPRRQPGVIRTNHDSHQVRKRRNQRRRSRMSNHVIHPSGISFSH